MIDIKIRKMLLVYHAQESPRQNVALLLLETREWWEGRRKPIFLSLLCCSTDFSEILSHNGITWCLQRRTKFLWIDWANSGMREQLAHVITPGYSGGFVPSAFYQSKIHCRASILDVKKIIVCSSGT